MLMELEKQKRGTNISSESGKDNKNQSTLWRSATQNHSIRGYDKEVMDHLKN